MKLARTSRRGVKGDPVGPVSAESMYSLFAQGTLTADSEIAQAASSGDPGQWLLAVEIEAFRRRIEARVSKNAQRTSTKELERRAIISKKTLLGGDQESNVEDDLQVVSSPQSTWPFRFPDLITPWMVKVIWFFTILLGVIWILYHGFGLIQILLTTLSAPSDRDGSLDEFIVMQQRAYLLQHGFLVAYGVVAIVYVRIMLEIVVVFFRIGKVLGCTEGEPRDR